jgi:6,7-dimethyl-8-ribityllumazine synthase
MSTQHKNLSAYSPETLPAGEDIYIGVLFSEWNEKITHALRDACVETLKDHGVKGEGILLKSVPGSFELPLAARWMLEHTLVQGVICLGCVVQGETPHFDYVCKGVTEGIMTLNNEYHKPVIFGVLTTLTMEQALDRAGGKYGNKGVEAAITALKMIQLGRELQNRGEEDFQGLLDGLAQNPGDDTPAQA